MEGADQILKKSVSINALQFSARFKSKAGVYFFLTVECQAELPKLKTVTIYWMKSLIDGKLKVSIYKL